MSVPFYIKTIVWGMKQRQLTTILRSGWEVRLDKIKRRKRYQQYVKQAISPAEGMEKLGIKKIDLSIFQQLEDHLDEFIRIKKEEKWPSIDNPYKVEFGLPRSICRFLYSLCLSYKPQIIVETGVANGFSSSYVLLALQNLEKGKLISLDDLIMPWQTKEKIGYAIPKLLRERHTILVGNALKNLKNIPTEYGQIDVFIHDSDHSYKHMTSEFNIIWQNIKKGGFLISDDVGFNDAFIDFAEKNQRTPIIISKDSENFYGVIQK